LSFRPLHITTNKLRIKSLSFRCDNNTLPIPNLLSIDLSDMDLRRKPPSAKCFSSTIDFCERGIQLADRDAIALLRDTLHLVILN